eukprot:10692445-Lingulodinium_polyedra.AAC.1
MSRLAMNAKKPERDGGGSGQPPLARDPRRQRVALVVELVEAPVHLRGLESETQTQFPQTPQVAAA